MRGTVAKRITRQARLATLEYCYLTNNWQHFTKVWTFIARKMRETYNRQ